MTHHPNTPAPRNDEAVADERALFEADVSKEFPRQPDLLRRRDFPGASGDYVLTWMQTRWVGWSNRAALAASRTEQAAPSVASGAVITSIKEMCTILDAQLIKADEYTDCTIVYKVTFDQLRNLYDLGRTPLAAPGAAIAACEQEAPAKVVIRLARHPETGEVIRADDSLASRQEAPAASTEKPHCFGQGPSRFTVYAKPRIDISDACEQWMKNWRLNYGESAESWMIEQVLQDFEPVIDSGLRAWVRNAASLLESKEWAEQFPLDADACRLEVAISTLVNTAPTAARSPATVAQPVTDEQIRRLFVAHGHLYAGWLELGRSILALRPPSAAAQSCPSKGCGGYGGEAFNDAQIEVLQFLTGAGKLRGCGFGEKPAEEWGNFWWRSALRAAFPGIPVFSTDKGDGGSKE